MEQKRRSKRHTVLTGRSERLWRLLGLQSNAGHPESVLKSGPSGKELRNGARRAS